MVDIDAYRAWKESIFGSDYMIWHDGLPTEAATGLVGADREEAIAMLRFGVGAGDSHAALALAAMGDVSSLGSIRAQIASSRGSEKVRLALSAHRLARDESLAEHLIDVMRSGGSWSDRIDAAIGLRHFEREGSEQALLETIETDSEYLVRYHACESVLSRWRVQPGEIAKHREIFERIVVARDATPSSRDFERFREARSMIEALRP